MRQSSKSVAMVVVTVAVMAVVVAADMVVVMAAADTVAATADLLKEGVPRGSRGTYLSTDAIATIV